VTWNWNSTWPY